MDNAFPLILIGFIALVIAIAVFSYHLKKKRREAFALVARQLGMEYWPQDPFGLLAEPFALFQKGDGRGIENVLAGAYQAVDVKAFDYWYYDESTNSKGHTSKTYYRFNCVIVPIDAACSPLTIDNENVLTRLADALSFRDIEFESEDFNRAFNVKSPDRKFANDFVDARMMQWLLQNGDGTAFEIMGDRLMCYRRKLSADGDRHAARPLEGVPGPGSEGRVLALRAPDTARRPRSAHDQAARTRRSGWPGTTRPTAPTRRRPNRWLPPMARSKLARPLRKEQP